MTEAAAGPAAVRVMPVTYLVTAWPPDLAGNPDAASWCLQVEWRGGDQWVITRGHGWGHGPYLSASLDWDFGPTDDELAGQWQAAHWFSLERALEMARDMAPEIVLMGMTTLECIAWHREEGRKQR